MHQPVLLQEVIEKLAIDPNGLYVDCTLGRCNHAIEILKHLSPNGLLIGFDLDQEAIEYCNSYLKDYSNKILINSSFANLKDELEKHHVQEVNGILFDLGVSSPQFDNPNRGFSYKGETKLDMRMDMKQDLDARKVINTYSEQDLADIFWKYGDEKFAKPIAREIVKKRQINSIETNKQLVEIIKKIKKSFQKKHPAKQIFQAIRIEVNDEINGLKRGLEQAFQLLKKDGLLLVITFHSLEDSIVKNYFYKIKNETSFETEFEFKKGYHTFKTIYPNKQEVDNNNRSRSAKLRIIKKIN